MTHNNLSAATSIDHNEKLTVLLNKLNENILGNPQATKLAVCCLLAQGHLLIEDLPGVGKTTLSKAIAALVGLPYKRVQFTSDLLPSDILGMTIFDMNTKKLQFKKGPVFTSVLLADEINRSNPKAQSALLQAMEEQKVSIDGNEIDLPNPFFVIATQNPQEQSGTFPLPESQLDRFLLRISLGYPSSEHEVSLLKNKNSSSHKNIEAVLTPSDLLSLIHKVNDIHVSDAIINYLQSLLQKTRDSQLFVNGLSPRAGLQWLKAAKALAFIEQRNKVLPEDIKYLAPFTASHRLQCLDGGSSTVALNDIIHQTEII